MFATAEHHRMVAEAYRKARCHGLRVQALSARALRSSLATARRTRDWRSLWRDWGLPELALGDAHRAVICRPDSASAYNTLGTVLAAMGQPETPGAPSSQRCVSIGARRLR